MIEEETRERYSRFSTCAVFNRSVNMKMPKKTYNNVAQSSSSTRFDRTSRGKLKYRNPAATPKTPTPTTPTQFLSGEKSEDASALSLKVSNGTPPWANR